MSTKKEILEYFKDINYAYNDSTRYDTLERMLSELEGEKMGNEERCVICGEIIPEGRQVCPICEARAGLSPEWEKRQFPPDYIDRRKLTAKMRELISTRLFNEEDMLDLVNEQPSADVVERKKGEWTTHEVACLLAEVIGDNCACNVNGNDEWLPLVCDFAETTCPDVAGVACWEQFLKHRERRKDNE